MLLVIVAPREVSLHRYLTMRFAGVPGVQIILDRRHGERRRAQTPHGTRRRMERAGARWGWSERDVTGPVVEMDPNGRASHRALFIRRVRARGNPRSGAPHRSATLRRIDGWRATTISPRIATPGWGRRSRSDPRRLRPPPQIRAPSRPWARTMSSS